LITPVFLLLNYEWPSRNIKICTNRDGHMKFAIMGSGGIGGYYGGRLADAGFETHFIARGRHLAAMRNNGLRIESPVGDIHLPQVNVTDDPSSIGTVDCILFTTKLWDIAAAAEACAPLIGQETAALSLHNGVSAEGALTAIYGSQHVMGGVAEITSFISEPGVISHRGDFARIRFGELDGSMSERGERIRQAIESAGIEAEFSDDIERILWLKFILIVGTTSLTALTRKSIGAVREDEGTRALLRQSIEEAIAVGRAKGVNLDEGTAEQRLAFIDRLPFAMTTSMAKDLDEGNALELEWFAGYVANEGRKLGVPTPLNDLAYTLLKMNAEGQAAG
jgi:2-dehydropantoate 2-reductase